MSENVAKEIGLCGEFFFLLGFCWKKKFWKKVVDEEEVHRVIVLVVQLDG